ncbi:MAG: hypothetical protein IH612_10660, partial [Desulfofustis sp.]|nr:hypothetical protein [Desulfofustis sp.]
LQRIHLIDRLNGQLIGQIINMIADNNLYYEIRILACEAIGTLLARNHHPFYASLQSTLLNALTAQLSVPQPINFRKALGSIQEAATLKFCIVNNE